MLTLYPFFVIFYLNKTVASNETVVDTTVLPQTELPTAQRVSEEGGGDGGAVVDASAAADRERRRLKLVEQRTLVEVR